MGAELTIESDEVRHRPEKSEVNRLFASNDKAKRILEWEPLYGGMGGFRRGLQQTIEWFKDERNLAMYKADIYNI